MGTHPTPAPRRGLWSGIAVLISSLLVLAVALCPPHEDAAGATRVAVEHHLDGCGVEAHEQHVPEPLSVPGAHQAEPVVTEFSTPLAETVNTPCASLPRPSGRALLVEISVARS